MSARVDEELAGLFRDAERECRCLVPDSKRVGDNLRRRLVLLSSEDGQCVVSPRCGVYARKAYWDGLNPLERMVHLARALAQKHPAWTFSHFTAAALRGWSVSFPLARSIHVAMPVRHSADGIVFHVLRPDAGGGLPHNRVHGIRTTTALQTLCDCLRTPEFGFALPIADSALRDLGMTSGEAVASIAADPMLRGTRSIRRVAEVLRYADGLSESGGESFARAAMIELGFEIPELQVEYADPVDPGSTFRADFRWELPDGGVVLGEFDGKAKYVDPKMTNGEDVVAVLTKERLRESHLSATGAKIMRFSYADVADRNRFEHLLESFGVPRR